jgi:enolase 1/2/3
MGDFTIVRVHARELLDSRGRPTVEADVTLSGGAVGTAAVPSGASTGSNEALELRDGDPTRYYGKGVLRAVANVNGEIASATQGIDAREQEYLDSTLVKLDGSPGSRKSRLGANSILAVSLANAKAAALQCQQHLFQYMREQLYPLPDQENFKLPVPMLNFINGGAHADNALDFQEFMLVPHGASSFEEAMRWSSDVYLTLVRNLRSGDSKFNSFGVGDEGGFSITTPEVSPEKTVEYVLTLLDRIVRDANYELSREGHFAVALDPAASEFFDEEKRVYVLGRRQRTPGAVQEWTSDRMIKFYVDLVDRYPIISIEDGLAETDGAGWKNLTRKLGGDCQLVGDDLFVTNPVIFRAGVEARVANAILVKVNQIGTLTESLEVIRIAQDHGYKAIVSHRSGETEDTTISDLAVATNAGQIKTGCLSRADRAAKYNRLLEIAKVLGKKATFSGHIAIANRRRVAA